MLPLPEDDDKKNFIPKTKTLMETKWKRVYSIDFVEANITKDDCKKLMKAAFDAKSATPDQKNVKKAGWELAATSPEIIMGWSYATASLSGCNWGFLWLAANKILGSKWKIQQPKDLPPKPIPKLTPTFASKDLLYQNKQTQSGCFLVRTKYTSASKKIISWHVPRLADNYFCICDILVCLSSIFFLQKTLKLFSVYKLYWYNQNTIDQVEMSLLGASLSSREPNEMVFHLFSSIIDT